MPSGAGRSAGSTSPSSTGPITATTHNPITDSTLSSVEPMPGRSTARTSTQPASTA